MPKILLWDIETTPNIVTAFNLDSKERIHYQNIIEERSIISISWKWLDKSEISSVCVSPEMPQNDRDILRLFSGVAQTADAIVAHYGDEFDIKFVNARLVYNGLRPLPNLVQIDTYKIAKSKFYFNSNKLDYLAKFLSVGEKIRTDYELWRRCMLGEAKALKQMVRYNRHDVVLLEGVYKVLAPFVKTKIRASLTEDSCEHCGLKCLRRRGTGRTLKSFVQRFQCMNCGHWQQTPIQDTK